MNLDIKKEQNGSALVISLAGSLDTMSAPTLQEELEHCLDGVDNLTFDFAQLSYISSAGLRCMVFAYKTIIGNNGTMKIIHVSEVLKEVFEITGLDESLNIQ